MKKSILDLRVVSNTKLLDTHFLLRLTSDLQKLPIMNPGQFVQVEVKNSSLAFLRRPISINFVDKKNNELWLLIQIIGEGTKHLSRLVAGDMLNIICPLGHGFTLPTEDQKIFKPLLIGGGVGIAPLLHLGATLFEAGYKPSFLLGARSSKDLLELDLFRKFGTVYTTTEDGSSGNRGFVTDHILLKEQRFNRIYSCGPKPMMMAVAKYAQQQNITCEVSLENRMACGVGACLCCVEEDKNKHNVCVCTEGPVFNIKDLSWLS